LKNYRHCKALAVKLLPAMQADIVVKKDAGKMPGYA